jgi:hypothetical protein
VRRFLVSARWLVGPLLLVGSLTVALPADEPAKSGWTSKELPKQTIPALTALSTDGRFLAEVIVDRTFKMLQPKFMGMPLPPDAVVLRDSPANRW